MVDWTAILGGIISGVIMSFMGAKGYILIVLNFLVGLIAFISALLTHHSDATYVAILCLSAAITGRICLALRSNQKEA